MGGVRGMAILIGRSAARTSGVGRPGFPELESAFADIGKVLEDENAKTSARRARERVRAVARQLTGRRRSVFAGFDAQHGPLGRATLGSGFQSVFGRDTLG